MTPAASPGAGRQRLVVLYGGRSAEHEVSCVSAAGVVRALDPARYEVVPIGISHGGTWMQADDLAEAVAAGKVPDPLPVAGRPVVPTDVLTDDVVVFPVLHGPYGEDGTVQGLLELAGVPYVGSGVLGSALAMDKVMAKQVLAQASLPQAHHLALAEWEAGPGGAEKVAAELGWPVFVKPANLGSSIGVSRAAGPDELAGALALAFSHDEWAVVEEAVTGREIECSVLGDREPRASLPGEIRPSHDFYDYEDKYVAGAAELLIPADLPPDVVVEVQHLAIETFTALRLEGMARVDFFYEEEGRGLLVNEANTIPGFTPISMYPKLWEVSGLPYPQLLDELIALALARHRRRASRWAGNRSRGGPPGR